MKLAREVRTCVFDFDAIADELRAGFASASDAEPPAADAVPPSLVTADACRLRWAQLDVTQWGPPCGGTGEAALAAAASSRAPDLWTDAVASAGGSKSAAPNSSGPPLPLATVVRGSGAAARAGPHYGNGHGGGSGRSAPHLFTPDTFPSVGDFGENAEGGDDDDDDDAEPVSETARTSASSAPPPRGFGRRREFLDDDDGDEPEPAPRVRSAAPRTFDNDDDGADPLAGMRSVVPPVLMAAAPSGNPLAGLFGGRAAARRAATPTHAVPVAAIPPVPPARVAVEAVPIDDKMLDGSLLPPPPPSPHHAAAVLLPPPTAATDFDALD